jgi:PAS domain S-box-containing protein
MDYLADSTIQESLDQRTIINVTDQAGNIILSNKFDSQKKVTTYSLFPVVKKALAENKNQIEIENQQTDQETSYLSIAEVKDAGWLVIIQRNFQSNLRPQQAENQLEIIIIFALLFITLSLVLMYLRKMILFKENKKTLLTEIKLLQNEKIEWEKRYHPENRGNHKNIPLIVWDHDLIIVRFDHTFEEMTGWSKEEVLGKKIDVLFPENSKKESLDRISSAAKSEKPEVLEVPILDSVGKTALAHGHYITARKQEEQEISILDGKLEKRVLERTANLEAANRQLEAFSYSISHALLIPLQTIEKLCDVLKEKYQGKTDDEEKNYLERMYRETKHMGQLIDDLQKLSRLNRTVINRKSVDVSKMAREIMEEYRQKYPDRDAAVTIEKDIIIEGDELLIKIALDNLIDNAWKFTASKEHTVIKFGSTIKDGKTVLFIRDNGIGFDMAHLNKLFGAFQRIDTNTDFPGTGIGLATVSRIVNRHGGEIWAESKPGKGATFYFTLS